MKIRPFRIPKSIVLPGMVVRVVQLPRESVELGGDGGGWAYDVPDGTGPAATIYIDRALALDKKRYTLVHELQHVMVDYLHMALKYHPEVLTIC